MSSYQQTTEFMGSTKARNIVIFKMTLMSLKLVWQHKYVERGGEQREEDT